MPLYIFEKNGEFKEIFFGMNEKKQYIDESGFEWIRIFSSPQAAINTKIDPMSAKDFSNKFGNKKGKLDDLFSASKEAAMKRKEKLGYDPVKQKYLEDWSKKRKGKVPPPSMTQD